MIYVIYTSTELILIKIFVPMLFYSFKLFKYQNEI